MKKNKSLKAGLVLLFLGVAPWCAEAQRGYIHGRVQDQIEQKMRAKYGDSARLRGREEVRKVSYENDTRYPDPQNRVQATILMETSALDKKGQPRDKMKTRLVFGPTGECMVLNEGDKSESRMIYDYEGRANYIVQVKEKTAMKMPLMSFRKMAERAARNQARDEASGSWEKTGETAVINGFSSRKYIYTAPDQLRTDIWVTGDVQIDLTDNYLFGSRIRSYAAGEAARAKGDMPEGTAIRIVSYNKKGEADSRMDITEFQKSYDKKYFDLTGFAVNDILDGL